MSRWEYSSNSDSRGGSLCSCHLTSWSFFVPLIRLLTPLCTKTHINYSGSSSNMGGLTLYRSRGRVEANCRVICAMALNTFSADMTGDRGDNREKSGWLHNETSTRRGGRPAQNAALCLQQCVVVGFVFLHQIKCDVTLIYL